MAIHGLEIDVVSCEFKSLYLSVHGLKSLSVSEPTIDAITELVTKSGISVY